MSLSMGISDETEVAMIAIDETPVSQIKATILLPYIPIKFDKDGRTIRVR